MSKRAMRFRNRHHLTPKSRMKSRFDPKRQAARKYYYQQGILKDMDDPDNVLSFDIERHAYWHKVFGTRTLEEVLALLKRLARAKHRL